MFIVICQFHAIYNYWIFTLIVYCIGSNSINLICCRFVVELIVQQIHNRSISKTFWQFHNKSNGVWILKYCILLYCILFCCLLWNEDYQNMDYYLLEIADRSLDDYRRRYFAAATANGTTLTGHFNNFALHSIATSLSLVDNAILHYSVPGSYLIETINHPLPRAEDTRTNDAVNDAAQLSFTFAYMVAFGMAFLVGSYATNCIELWFLLCHWCCKLWDLGCSFVTILVADGGTLLHHSDGVATVVVSWNKWNQWLNKTCQICCIILTIYSHLNV